MKYRTRTFRADKQYPEVWDRWLRGASMSAIGRHFKSAEEAYKSQPCDRGSERTGHRKVTMVTKIGVLLRDPQSPWQRGNHENTNRLFRQYVPKGIIIMSGFSQAELCATARQRNERPRKTLKYHTPSEKSKANVAAIR